MPNDPASSDAAEKQVRFTQMKDGTRDEYIMLRELELPHNAMTADRLLRELERQGEETLPGYRITRLGHALQTATRAWRDGADRDWIVCALLHDIGDGLAPQNHDRFAAEIVRPFVREECTWVVEHHGAFQMAERTDHGAGLHRHAGREDHERLDRDASGDLRVVREMHRLGRLQGDAVGQRPGPHTPLEHALGLGELHGRVAAHHRALRREEPVAASDDASADHQGQDDRKDKCYTMGHGQNSTNCCGPNRVVLHAAAERVRSIPECPSQLWRPPCL